MDCKANLNLQGGSYPCDWPSDEDGRHDGWAHTNKEIQAVWVSPTDFVPGMAGEVLVRGSEDIDQEAVRQLFNAACQWGQLGVLRVAKKIYHPDAWAALEEEEEKEEEDLS